MDKIHFKLDVEQLTFDEMIAIQEGQLRQAKAILVKFATDAKGNPLPEDEATEKIGNLNYPQMTAVFKEFGEQLTASVQGVLPNG